MTTGRYRLRGALALYLAASCVLPAALSAQPPRDFPVVSVAFDLSGAPLYRNLPDPDELERDIAAYLAEKCAQVPAIGFVRWRTASDASVPPDDVKATLTARLEQEDSRISPEFTATEIRLTLAAETVERALPDLDIGQTLFGFEDLDKHVQNPDKLKQRIRSAIDAWFEDTGAQNFEQALSDRFLKHVPLSQNVQVDSENYLLILPLRAQSLETSAYTPVLRATFLAEKNGATHGGRLTMEVKTPFTPPGSTDQLLYCQLRSFFYPHAFFYQFPPLDLDASSLTPESLHSTFGRDIEEILSQTRLASLTVYMDTYRASSSPIVNQP